MKKAKKLLALFMSALMVFSMFSGLEITSFAWFWDDEPTLDIVSLEVEPGTVIENYNGYWDLKWGEDLMEIEFYYYFLDELDYTVTLSDGTVLESFYGYVEYDDVLYSLDSVDSQYANPLTLGANEVTVSLEGFETTAIVEVVETPVSAVSIDTVYLVENSDGFWDTTYDEAEFFCYNMPYFNYTVTLNDGTVLESDEIGSFMYNGREHYMAECFDQYETPLTPGENYVTVDVLGFEATAIVEIIETPVVAMEIEPIIVVKETKGNWDIEYDDDWNATEYFCYDLFFTDYTVTLNDGTVLESDYGYITYGGIEYYIEKNFSQSEEPLNVGINEIPVSILGFNTTAVVEIIETPVASVEIEPLKLIELYDGFWDLVIDDDFNITEYFCYNLNNFDFTVTMKDGTVIESELGEIEYDGAWYGISANIDQESNPLTVGTYEIPVSILGFDTTAIVEIVEMPVANVEVAPVTLVENVDGEWDTLYDEDGNEVEFFYYDYITGTEFTVTLNDGTVIESVDGYAEYDGIEYYIDFNYDQYDAPLTLGTYEITVFVAGFETMMTVEIIDGNAEASQFEYYDEGGLFITGVNSATEEILEIPADINGNPVVGINYLGTDVATEIIIPDSVKFLSYNWLEGCNNVSKITFGSSVAEISDSIFEYAPIAEINVSENNPNYKSIDGVLYTKDGKTLVIYPVAKGNTYEVPASVTDINAIFVNSMYSGIDVVIGADSALDYVTVDGVIYNKDKTQVIYCNPSKTGDYVMPDTVNKISAGAFKGSGVESITISKNVNEIVYAAFANCSSLKNITIPDSIKSIGEWSFAGCTSLTEITIPDSVTELGRDSFDSCISLKNVAIGKSVTAIEPSTFRSCKALTNVTLPETLESIGASAFRYSESLKTIDFPESLTSIGDYAFECSGLTAVDLPDSVTQMGEYVFYGCENLKSVKLSAGLKEVAWGSFMECTSLESITVPDSIEYIPPHAFRGTPYIENAANYKDGLLYLGKVLYLTNDAVKETVTVDPGTVTIGEYAFSTNETIKTLVLPEGLKNIGDYAFAGCTNLSAAEFTNGLEVIGYEAFVGTALKSAKLPDTVNQIVYRAFYSTNVTEIDMPDTLVALDEDTFDETPWYNAQPDGMIYLGSSLYEYKGYIERPQTIKVNEGTLSIAGGAFENESNLTGIELPKGLVDISPAAFFRTGLKSVTIPSTVKRIGVKAFYNSALETVEIGNGVEYIGDNAFDECNALKSVTIPPSVKEIGSYAFDGWNEELVIYGATGSAAEEYATKYRIEFVATEFEPTTLVIHENSGITMKDSTVNLPSEMTTSAFASGVENKKVLVLSTDGTELATDAFAGTGNKIQVLGDDGSVLSEYVVMVKSDVDGDGKVTPADARLALRAATGLDILEGVYAIAANYDDTDTVSPSDARMILRKAAGLEK